MLEKSDKRYKINVTSSGRTLTYTDCKLISDNEWSLTFTDKFGIVLTVNRAMIISMEEVKQ
jgi:hypothetical protein